MTPSKPPSAGANMANELTDLTNQAKQLFKGGDGNALRLSPTTVQNHITMVQNQQQQVASVLDQLKLIPHFAGQVGHLPSALAIAAQFDDAITKVERLLTKYKQYADDLANAVGGPKGAFTKIIAEDQATGT
jgi:hypothetical protein